jgi:DNA-binding transcriptional LysR family regulator
MRFDWTDLRIFLHVCEAGSMTGAAARCHLTLAAVSARMRSLEEANGVVLLQRQARGVAPTPAGEVLAAHARRVFEQVQQLERDLLHARGETPRRTVLLANSSALARPLAGALAALLAAPADRPLLVRESSSEATVQALRSGAADVGIVSDAVDTRGLVVEELGPDPLVLVTASDGALAQRASVPFPECLAQPWVAWGEQSALLAHLQLRALALGARIEARVTYPALAGLLDLVARGIGVTVLPLAVLAGHPGAAGLACIPLEEAWARRRLLVCRPAGADPSRMRLMEGIARQWRAAGSPA